MNVTDLLGVLSKVLTLGDSGSKLTDLLGLFDLEHSVTDEDP